MLRHSGRTDAKQAAVVAADGRDLHFPARVEVLPDGARSDGFAMSSCHIYLDPAEREQ